MAFEVPKFFMIGKSGLERGIEPLPLWLLLAKGGCPFVVEAGEHLHPVLADLGCL